MEKAKIMELIGQLSLEDKAFCDGVMGDVNNYITEMEIKFITGEEPLSNFDNYVKQLEKMGVRDALEIYRREYDKFMSR